MLVAIAVVNTRGMRLKRLAQTLQMRYDARLDHILTEDAYQYALFFQQGVHRFFQVLTKQEPNAFMRVCEDRISAVQATTSAQQTYTLLTAELMRGLFTPLILMPLQAGQAGPAHPALAPDLASKYMLSAPEDYRFPQTVLGFLQAAKPCYLELTPTAFIYHEFDRKPVSQIQPMRFRAKQLIQALTHQPAPVQATPVQSSSDLTKRTTAQPISEEALQAAVMLKLQTAQSGYAAGRFSQSNRWVYGIIFLSLLTGLCLFTAFALRNWVLSR